MANYSIISDLGNEIVKLLRKNLCPEPITNPENILLCPPFEKGDFTLGIHLYDIQEDADFQQLNMINISETKRRYPPLPLTLYYMITVNSQSHISSKSIDEQRILGRVLQVLYDNPVFSITNIQPNAESTDTEIYLTPNTLQLEEKSRLWSNSGSGNSSKLALYYKAAPILIDSERTTESRRVVSVDVNLFDKEGKR